MTKITAEHLARSAIDYIRQSTSYQVANNLESQRRQYALVERGRLLDWKDVQVIDDDLGRSGSGIARPCFEKLLPPYARAALAPSCRSKPRVSRATDVIGTRCSSSADL